MAKKVTGSIKLEIPAGARRTRRRRWARRWVSAASTSWSSARRSTPPRRTSSRAPRRRSIITAYSDRSFTFETKTAPAAFYLKRAAKINKGAKTPKMQTVGSVTLDQVREIAEAKFKDLNAYDIETAMESIKGSARSMGIEVTE